MAYSFSYNRIYGNDPQNIKFRTGDGREWYLEIKWDEKHGKEKITVSRSEKDDISEYLVIFCAYKLSRHDSKPSCFTLAESLDAWHGDISFYFNQNELYKTEPLSMHGTVYRRDRYRYTVTFMPTLTLVNSGDDLQPEPVTEPAVDGQAVGQPIRLSKDMKSLLKDGILSDFVLKSGSTRIKVHRCVLAARSPVFARMFQSEMKESQEREIIISDVETPILKDLVTYIYTGTVKVKDVSCALDILAAADKYDLEELKHECSVWLQTNMRVDSVISTIALADDHGDSALKAAAIEFIAKNFARVKATDGWASLLKERQTLSLEIISSVFNKLL